MATTASEINLWRTRFNNANDRIRQLEKQCEVLAVEVDRMRLVVEATIKEVTRDDDRFSWYELKKAVNDYESSKPK